MHDTTSEAVSAFQISHLSPCTAPLTFCPNLTQYETHHGLLTAPQAEMSSLE